MSPCHWTWLKRDSRRMPEKPADAIGWPCSTVGIRSHGRCCWHHGPRFPSVGGFRGRGARHGMGPGTHGGLKRDQCCCSAGSTGLQATEAGPPHGQSHDPLGPSRNVDGGGTPSPVTHFQRRRDYIDLYDIALDVSDGAGGLCMVDLLRRLPRRRP